MAAGGVVADEELALVVDVLVVASLVGASIPSVGSLPWFMLAATLHSTGLFTVTGVGH